MIAAPTDRTGTLLAGKYLLLRLLGSGGMGAVYEARNEQTHGRVAVKVLRDDACDPTSSRARLLHEARALAKLSHPNIVRLYDADVRDGELFLVQELIEGATLRRMLDERLVLDARETVELLVPLTAALGYAHRLGVVHRDVKPENVLLCDDGRGGSTPRLIDFGIALASSETRSTRAGAAVGTPSYMSPEQAVGSDDIDARSDVWSLGVLAYECLAGEAPYEGANDRAVLAAIVSRDPRHLAHAAPSVPEALADVVMRALVRARDGRIASMSELRAGLLKLECFAGEPWFTALRDGRGSDREPAVPRAAARPHSGVRRITIPRARSFVAAGGVAVALGLVYRLLVAPLRPSTAPAVIPRRAPREDAVQTSLPGASAPAHPSTALGALPATPAAPTTRPVGAISTEHTEPAGGRRARTEIHPRRAAEATHEAPVFIGTNRAPIVEDL